jgi:SAM-dependent methyltransferase
MPACRCGCGWLGLMHQAVFGAFDRICRERGAEGPVLEVGAVAAPDTLLLLPSIRSVPGRVGVSLDGPFEVDGCEVRRGNANAMPVFADASFGTVLCNATLEHDPRFWESLAEMRRVLRPGGLMVIGVPAFLDLGMARWTRWLRLLPLPRRIVDGWLASTLTLHVHNHPVDCYRFGEEACRTVLLEGLTKIAVETLLVPPRLVGSGIRPWD